jgi:flagellar biogenesis protein FliO
MDNYVQELLFVILALLFVVMMAWLLLKGLKGFHSQYGDGTRMKLMLTLSVGTRERLVVINYRDHEYLIGITPSSIMLLDKLPAGEENPHTSNPGPET